MLLEECINGVTALSETPTADLVCQAIASQGHPLGKPVYSTASTAYQDFSWQSLSAPRQASCGYNFLLKRYSETPPIKPHCESDASVHARFEHRNLHALALQLFEGAIDAFDVCRIAGLEFRAVYFQVQKRETILRRSEEVMRMAGKDATVNHDKDALAEQRTPDEREALARLQKLAEEQCVKPLTLERIKAMGSVWPEDESIDDFIAAVQEWRSEGGERDLP